MYRGNVSHLARTMAWAAFAAMLAVLPPAMARDRDDDDRGRGHSHHHGDDRDDLAAELKELKERVRKLEGRLTSEEVAGSYVFRSSQAALITNNNNTSTIVGRLEHLSATGDLELNANGTFSFLVRENGFNAIWSFPTNRERVDRADSGSGTWTYIGGLLRLDLGGGDVVVFGGGVGGRLFLWVGSNPADGTTTHVTLTRKLDR